MGHLHLIYLEKDNIYICSKCGIHLSTKDDIISKTFQARHGKAYLFNSVINVKQGPLEDRILSTGLHTVCDIYCIYCLTIVGWKYERAFETSQKYKEGKYILERELIRKK